MNGKTKKIPRKCSKTVEAHSRIIFAVLFEYIRSELDREYTPPPINGGLLFFYSFTKLLSYWMTAKANRFLLIVKAVLIVERWGFFVCAQLLRNLSHFLANQFDIYILKEILFVSS